jgi:hypothetical protein
LFVNVTRDPTVVVISDGLTPLDVIVTRFDGAGEGLGVGAGVGAGAGTGDGLALGVGDGDEGEP